jgi:hypothetical protein
MPMTTHLLLAASRESAVPPAGTAPVVPAAILLGLVVLALGLFALGAVLLARSHRRRLRSHDRLREEPPAAGPTDAWREAGRRLAESNDEE